MNNLDQIYRRLLEMQNTKPAFSEKSHELLMSNSFMMGVMRDVGAMMPIIKDPALDGGKIEIMGFGVVIDDSLADFEFRIKRRA